MPEDIFHRSEVLVGVVFRAEQKEHDVHRGSVERGEVNAAGRSANAACQFLDVLALDVRHRDTFTKPGAALVFPGDGGINERLSEVGFKAEILRHRLDEFTDDAVAIRRVKFRDNRAVADEVG